MDNLEIEPYFLTDEERRLIKGCLLTTKETFKLMPFKNSDIKAKLKQIDELLLKFDKSGS